MIAGSKPPRCDGLDRSSRFMGGRGLSELGVDQRLVVRDHSKAPALPGAHIATADYG